MLLLIQGCCPLVLLLPRPPPSRSFTQFNSFGWQEINCWLAGWRLWMQSAISLGKQSPVQTGQPRHCPPPYRPRPQLAFVHCPWMVKICVCLFFIKKLFILNGQSSAPTPTPAPTAIPTAGLCGSLVALAAVKAFSDSAAYVLRPAFCVLRPVLLRSGFAI